MRLPERRAVRAGTASRRGRFGHKLVSAGAGSTAAPATAARAAADHWIRTACNRASLSGLRMM